MTNKELLIQEIESLPSELLTEALDFIRSIKITHVQNKSISENEYDAGQIPSSTARDLLEFAGVWEGDDIRECLQLVHDTRMPLEP